MSGYMGLELKHTYCSISKGEPSDLQFALKCSETDGEEGGAWMCVEANTCLHTGIVEQVCGCLL